jgi:hypothetical protein
MFIIYRYVFTQLGVTRGKPLTAAERGAKR